MLETLKRYGEAKAAGLLAEATRSLLPHPVDVELKDEIFSVLREARSALGISESDRSDRATSRLLNYFSDLLTDHLLPKNDLRNARARLGTKGLLKPNQYTITFNPAITTRGAPYRAQWGQVAEAIQNADIVEHFRAVEGKADAPLVSLFIRRSPSKQRNSNFYWLIECHRNGASLFPAHAWRLFPDVFKLYGITPKEAITLFAEKFGLDIKVGSEIKKIFFRQGVPLSKEAPTRIIEGPGVSFVMPASMEEEALVGFSYAIDKEQYNAYLDAHGIRLR